MKDFGKSKFGGGSKGGYKSKSFGGSDSYGDGPQMHHAVCNKCGKDCTVPFKPNGRKPVFCSDCFEGQEDGGSNRSSFGGRDGGNFGGRERESSYGSKHSSYSGGGGRQGGFGGNRRDGGNSGGGQDNRAIQEQLNAINAKLDQILESL